MPFEALFVRIADDLCGLDNGGKTDCEVKLVVVATPCRHLLDMCTHFKVPTVLAARGTVTDDGGEKFQSCHDTWI